MAKRQKQKAKSDKEEEELKESKMMMEGSGVGGEPEDDDDEEANEDLSLKIVEKALLMRAAKLAQNDNDGVVLDDSASSVVELASSPLVDADVEGPSGVKNKKKKKKKKKRMGTGIGDLSVIVAKKEDKKENVAVHKEVIEPGDPEMVSKEVVESGDPEITDNVVLRKLLRGPRYFDPPDCGWSTCYNCGEEGHMAVNCPSFTKKEKPCFVCGSLDHGAKQCPKGQDCFICKIGGHHAKDCPERYGDRHLSSKICLKCGGSGHDMFACRDDYSLDDLKEIQCYICKNFGHLCCVNLVDDIPREVSCYRCGELGHTGLACSRLREEATLTTSPSSCYKCGGEGHFARECRSSAKAGKRNHEFSTPTLRVHKENKDDLGIKSAPHDLGKAPKRRKSKFEERGITTPRKSKYKVGLILEDPGDSSQSMPYKSKHRGGWTTKDPGDSSQSMPQKSKCRGGWIAEDPGDFSQSNTKKNLWRSPSTPYKGHKISTITSGDHVSSSRSCKKMQRNHSGNSVLQGSTTAFGHGFSTSRYGNSGSVFVNPAGGFGNSSSLGISRNYGWW